MALLANLSTVKFKYSNFVYAKENRYILSTKSRCTAFQDFVPSASFVS